MDKPDAVASRTFGGLFATVLYFHNNNEQAQNIYQHVCMINRRKKSINISRLYIVILITARLIGLHRTAS